MHYKNSFSALIVPCNAPYDGFDDIGWPLAKTKAIKTLFCNLNSLNKI